MKPDTEQTQRAQQTLRAILYAQTIFQRPATILDLSFAFTGRFNIPRAVYSPAHFRRALNTLWNAGYIAYDSECGDISITTDGSDYMRRQGITS